FSSEWDHSCAVKTDDTVRCWGYNSNGQSTVPGDLGTAKQVSTGWRHTCAIKTNDTVRCWGDNAGGQTNIPGDLGTVKQISSGEYHNCAVKTDNTVACWGLNISGETDIPMPTVSLGLTGSPLAETGGVAQVNVQLSEYPWTNVGVTFGFSGSATFGVDYQASSTSLNLTTSDQTGSITLTGLADTEVEGDETIIVDIDTVAGGTEDGTQQVTAIIQNVVTTLTPTSTATATLITSPTPTATPTATPTEIPYGTELVVNGGFEDTALLPWSVKNNTGDKIKCDKPGKPVAHTGTCAFRFKGGVGEKGKLLQILDLTTVTFAAGDTLEFSLYLNASSAAATGKAKLVIQYADDTASHILSLNLVTTAGYQRLDDEYILLSGAVSKLKILVKHKSPAGKIYLDDISLTHSAVADTFTHPVPLP
ncbi:MAG TPA: hypothetical protein VHL11_06175, partial [Phototrophicaceae bacterium]|nr:hypothetical protein [Phototrophicaceae bacterium]